MTEIPFFQGVATLYREQASSLFETRDLANGDVLFEEGATDQSVACILQGELEIVRGDVVVDTSGPGEVLGELGLFVGRPRMATVRARGKARVALLPRSHYDKLVADENPVAYNLERAALVDLGNRLARLDTLIAEHAEGEPTPFAPGFFGAIRNLLGGKKKGYVQPSEIDPIEVLESSGLFAGASYEHLHAIAAQLRQETFPDGTFLCTQGQPGDKMFFLGAGAVEVVVCMGDPTVRGSRVQHLGQVPRGSAFAMSAVIGDRPRGVSCVATTDVDTFTIDRKTFDRFTNSGWPEASTFRQGIIRSFGDQLTNASTALMRLIESRPDVALVEARAEAGVEELAAAASVEFSTELQTGETLEAFSE